VVLLVVTLSVPALRRAFDLGAISLTDWGIAVLAGFIGVMWFEVYKAVARR